jgi:drug/metabolite transporter (DMT)-like permease
VSISLGEARAFLPSLAGRIPRNLAASLLMLAAFLIFCLMAVLMRIVGPTIPVFEIVLLRQIVGFLLFAPLFIRAWSEVRHPTAMKLHMARGGLAVGSMSCGLTAVVLLPLADVTAIQMAEVLFITALAAPILGEHVGWRRWTAAAVGFVGIAIMLKPFGQGFDANSLLPLIGALFGAGGVIALRLGASHDRTETVLFWQGVVVLLLVAPLALWRWVTPTPYEALMLAAMGIVFAAGQWLFTSAARMGDASALAPLQYVRLLLMALLGWQLYGEVPTLATATGGALVLAAATYTIGRNARRDVPVKTSDVIV